MTDQRPLLNQVDLVVRDVDASVAFYRLLGLDIPESSVWRTASGAHHADLTLSNGVHFHIDSVALTRHFDRGWPEASPSGTTNIVGFALPTRQAVDERYAMIVAAGHAGRQAPDDAFWGARYAVVEDPDGNQVGLMSPIDPSRRREPPAL